MSPCGVYHRGVCHRGVCHLGVCHRVVCVTVWCVLPCQILKKDRTSSVALGFFLRYTHEDDEIDAACRWMAPLDGATGWRH